MVAFADTDGSDSPPALERLIICEHCDAVWTRPPLAAGELARCGRCGATLMRAPWLPLSGQLALVVTATIVFLIANAFPVVVLDVHGLRQGSTLLGALIALSAQGAVSVALVAAVTVIVCPLLELAIRGWVLVVAVSAETKTRPRSFGHSLRLLTRVQRWSMTEVYVIGILVTVVKLGSMAEVIPGIGLASFGLLAILIGALRYAGIDPIWAGVDSSSRPRSHVAENLA